MRPNNADFNLQAVKHDQTALGLHCLYRPICPYLFYDILNNGECEQLGLSNHCNCFNTSSTLNNYNYSNYSLISVKGYCKHLSSCKYKRDIEFGRVKKQ